MRRKFHGPMLFGKPVDQFLQPLSLAASGRSQIDVIFASPPRIANHGAQMRKGAAGIDQGRRLGGVLLRLDN
jgi:hypothetical protein